ncbi:hypothetical protein L9F63_000076, partial [Diploptera punctata]
VYNLFSYTVWCISCERSLNYATKMARVLQSSTCEEQRSVVRFLWAKGHKPSEIHRDMRGVYGDDCMDRSNVSRWCTFFQEGRVNLSDSPRSGRPTTAAIPQNVRGIEAAILNDRRVQLRALSQKFNISYGIVTGDESWAYHYTPETKQASMEWKHAGSPVKKKFKVTQSARKKFLAGKRFETDVEVKSAVRRWLHSNQTDFYEQGILKL